MNKIGYACMNRTLREANPAYRCNRGMQKQTFESRGSEYVSELALKNFKDLLKILQWNVEKNIFFYRCSSNIIPWKTSIEVKKLKDYTKICDVAKQCKKIITQNNMRFTFHPSHWCKLASKSAETRENSIEIIEKHADILNLLSLPETPYYSVNVHIGGHYSDKEKTAERFVNAYNKLTDRAQSHVTVENDDTESLWSVYELAETIHERTNIPVVFDYHHHKFTSRNTSYKTGFKTASRTWPKHITPITHYSEAKRLHEQDTSINPVAHSDYVSQVPNWLQNNSDVMVESKAKEKAVLNLKNN